MKKGGGMGKRFLRAYARHLWANWKVAGRSLAMGCFHFIHGIVPARITGHGFWGFGGHGKKGIKDKRQERGGLE
jgi:hypothetical protein